MRKKALCNVLALGMMMATSAMAFTSCGPNAQVDEEGNVIVRMTIMDNEYETPGWLAMIDAANEVLEKNNEKVRIQAETIVTSSWDEYYAKVSSNIFGRTGGTIGRIAESHVPTMIQNGQAADLTEIKEELVSSGDYSEDFFGGVAEKDGKYYALPSGSQIMVLYYNKTLFDQYNATAAEGEQIEYPSSDWSNASTFEEIRDMAKKLTVGEGVNKRFGISAGPFLSYIGMYAVNSGGDNIFDEDGNCVINSQPFIDAYDWFGAMLQEDQSMPLPQDTQIADNLGRFVEGNVAMLIDGVWQMYYINKYSADFEIGIAAIPVLNNTYTSYTTAFADQFWASSTSSTPEEDKIALRALMSKEATETVAKMQIGGYPVRPDCVDVYLNAVSESKFGEYSQVISEGVQNKISVPYSVFYNQADMQINQKLSLWIAGDISTQDFVAQAHDIMEKGMLGVL